MEEYLAWLQNLFARFMWMDRAMDLHINISDAEYCITYPMRNDQAAEIVKRDSTTGSLWTMTIVTCNISRTNTLFRVLSCAKGTHAEIKHFSTTR